MTCYICSLKILVAFILIWELIYLPLDCTCFWGYWWREGGRLERSDWNDVFILRSWLFSSVGFILIKLQLVLTLVNAYLFSDLIAIAWSFDLHLVLWQLIKQQQNKPELKSATEEETRRTMRRGQLSSHWISWTKCLCPFQIRTLKLQLPTWWYLEVNPLGENKV